MARRTLICRCSHRQLLAPEALAEQIAQREAAGDEVRVVGDLCEACADHDAELKAWCADGAVEVVACHTRAVEWLLHQAGIPASAIDTIHDLRAPLSAAPQTTSNQQLATSPAPPLWLPWFPVIDYSRCTGCKQCLSFCPFGVYSHSLEEEVAVTSPRNCKNNCPACARICPQLAIIFPKFKQGPISGEPVGAADVAEVREVLSEQAEGDLHALLAKRKLRAAYRKLERLAAAEEREPTQEELAAAMVAAEAKVKK